MKPTLSLSLLVACTVWAASPAWSESEETKVQRTIRDLAEAYMAFPQTRDRQSVIKYFSPDFSFFDDAGPRSRRDIERMLLDLERDLGNGPVVISEEITDIQVHLENAVSWATYCDRVTIARDENVTDDTALCTAIFHKTLAGWVYQHEHCSSKPLENDQDHEELTNLTWSLSFSAAE